MEKIWSLSENQSQWGKMDNYSIGSWELRHTEEVECPVIMIVEEYCGPGYLRCTCSYLHWLFYCETTYYICMQHFIQVNHFSQHKLQENASDFDLILMKWNKNNLYLYYVFTLWVLLCSFLSITHNTTFFLCCQHISNWKMNTYMTVTFNNHQEKAFL